MRPVYRSVPVIICSVLALLLLGVIGFIPLFGGPGYESSLAAGLVLPSLVAIATALTTARSRPIPSAAFVRGLETAFLISGVGFLTTMLHGIRVGFCDMATGTALYALGPMSGTMLAGAWGVLAGEIAGRANSRWWRRVLAVGLAISAPLLGVLVSLWRFYSSPMIFSYDPFFGFFSGALYDTVVTDSMTTLMTYRAGSAASLFAAGMFYALFDRDRSGQLVFSTHRHPGVVWFGVAAAAASLIVTAEGWRMGHWQTSETIATELGGRVVDERCEVIYPRSLSEEAARLLLRDCAVQSRQVISFLGITQAPRVTVFVFGNRPQKRRLTGASHTSIAKPWRQEVYVELDGYPHPVLGHELAHVLMGVFARGPFKVGGTHQGWWPNPGLIEGVAVAASPDDDELTPQQWSAAMLQLGVLPSLTKVFALGFLGENSSTSYTVAGAFVDWIRTKHGTEAIQRWYAGESLDQVTGASLAEMEHRWKEELGKIHIEPAALAQAKSRFDRPGVFHRQCPHAVDAFNTRGRALALEGDCVGAAVAFGSAWSLDSHDWASRLGLASCAPRLANVVSAQQQWELLATDESLPSNARLRAIESLGDLYLVDGKPELAERTYQGLLDKLVDEDRLRTLDIKLRATRNPLEARAVSELLIGSTDRGVDQKLAYSLLGKWMAEVPGDGLPAYLIGRNLMQSGLWAQAAEFLDWALERRLPEGRVAREALRLRVVVACAQRDEPTARRIYARWKASPGLAEIRWQVLERQLGSCITDPGESASGPGH